MFLGDKELFEVKTLMSFVKIVILATCILIVAIPEGLPLAVSIAMALSINKLKKDEILIKNINAVQTCAMVHDICIGKTGTITSGNMSVVKYQFCDQNNVLENSTGNNFSQGEEISTELKNIVKEAIICNSDVRLEPNDAKLVYEPKGQAMEVAMVQFLLDNDEDVHENMI